MGINTGAGAVGGGRGGAETRGDRGGARTSGGGAAAAGQAAARLYKDPEVGGLVTNYGAPVHTTPEGTFAANPEKHGINQDKMKTYNSAVRDWNDHLVQNNIIGHLAPFGLQNVAPRLNQPATYTGGTYHFGMNPAAALGSLAGFAVPGAGIPASTIMGKGYSLAGGKDVVFSGPEQPSSWSKFSGDNTGTAPQSQSASAGLGRPTEGGQPQIPGPVQPSMPSIMNPQAAQQAAQQAQVPSIFTRKPQVQSQFQVPGGNPYGFNIFGRAA